MKRFIVLAAAGLALASCSSKKELQLAATRYGTLDSNYRVLQTRYSNAQDSIRKYQAMNRSLTDQLASSKDQLNKQGATNDQLVNQLKDLSVISSSQAESIKKSLDNISGKDSYIRDLQGAIARKDSLNMALVMNLKGAIGDLNDKDINIKVEKGVVYVDISDKMLFQTGKYEVTEQAKTVLGKVAKVLNAHPEIEFLVEGHTDNVPYKQGVLLDNWDLSVKRATAVVRILQGQYGVPAARMTAAGRGEYVSIASNDTAEGKAQNRRTRIVILPQLDQFFKLLEKPGSPMTSSTGK